MATDWAERQRDREERVEKLKNDYLKKLRGEREPSGLHRAVRRMKQLLGGAAFALILVGVWWGAPRLGLWGSEATEATTSVEERLDDLGEELRQEVEERTGIELALPTTDLVQGEPTGGWALPLARIDSDRATRPHHDYAAWDYGAPVGTEVYAMTSGTITTALADDDARCGGTVTLTTAAEGAAITHCHLSEVLVERWEEVAAGDLIGLTGGVPGAPGAGNTTGPHLHLSIRLDGTLRCPQAALVALADDTPLAVRDLPTTGCFYATSGFAGTDALSPDHPFFIWDD